MLDFLKTFFRPAPPSGATAKERLRLVLLSDHLSLAPDVVDALKRDLIEVISRYVEIDAGNTDVSFEHREHEIAMLASIPITAVRDREKPVAPPPPLPPTPPQGLIVVPKVEPAPEPVAEAVAPVAEAVAPLAEASVDAEPEPAAVAEAADAGEDDESDPETDGELENDAPTLELVPAMTPVPARSANAGLPRRRRRRKTKRQAKAS